MSFSLRAQQRSEGRWFTPARLTSRHSGTGGGPRLAGEEKGSIRTLRVNGESHAAPAGELPLLAFLRGGLGLLGPKLGCGEGACGACTVLADGSPVLSCQMTMEDVFGREITTVEGAVSETAARLKASLAAAGASQCGYCSPGMVLRAIALLESNPRPDEAEVREWMAPNICRCGCYQRITKGIVEAAGTSREDGEGEPALGPSWGWRPHRPFDLTDPAERQWFELLGEGIIATSSPELEASFAGRSGAWIHLSPSGEVTAFTGKVDVGQDNTTAFRRLVAEELSIDPVRVRVVLGDTDLCPYDMGTFGSRSMPDAGEALRQVAAGLRCRLVSKAADRLGLPPRALQASDGAVRTDSETIGYEILAANARDVEVVGPGQELVSSSRRLAEADLRPDRSEAFEGRRRFVSDLRVDQTGFGLVLHPPMAGDRLASLDREAISRLKGVQLVEEDGFAGVVADDLGTALKAARALSPEFEPAGDPFGDLGSYLRSHPADREGFEGAFEDREGDLEAGLSRARTAIVGTYTTAYIAHVPLETRAALASFEGGRLTVVVGTQTPFRTRGLLASALSMEEADVRVVVAPTGGAFGGKHGADVATEAARLSRAAGRPVLVHWSREEEFTAGYLRPAALVDVRAGLDEEGRLVGFELTDTNAGPAGMSFPYRAESRRLSFQPARSPLRQGSYRALGATANHFARESAIDELAALAGEDPASFRLRLLDDVRLRELLQLALDRFGWHGERQGGERGVGVALGLEKGGRVVTCAEIAPDRQGFRVSRMMTAYDCGRVVNPDTVVNQVEGATVMALGGALFEEIRLEDGRQETRHLAQYRVPRFTDMPSISVELLDRPGEPSAGAGETPLVAVAPAVANAVFSATGIRLRSLPLLPAFREQVG